MNSTRTSLRARLLTVGVTLALATIAVMAVQQSLTSASATATSLGEVDGATREGSRPDVFDTEHPTVTNLDPELLAALRLAGADARDDGVYLEVTSGWRSEALQAKLLQDAVTEYGSAAEAARWVATPETSAHVTGDAVDLGPARALDWLAQHGDRYGLCQIYANEPWHYELRPHAPSDGCPGMYADPTDDPRMQS